MTKCEHIDENNKEDCDEDAELMCKCCGIPSCEEHAWSHCEFWWLRFTDL